MYSVPDYQCGGYSHGKKPLAIYQVTVVLYGCRPGYEGSSNDKCYLNVIWMFNFGQNILDQFVTFQQCSGPNIPRMFLFDVI